MVACLAYQRYNSYLVFRYDTDTAHSFYRNVTLKVWKQEHSDLHTLYSRCHLLIS